MIPLVLFRFSMFPPVLGYVAWRRIEHVPWGKIERHRRERNGLWAPLGRCRIWIAPPSPCSSEGPSSMPATPLLSCDFHIEDLQIRATCTLAEHHLFIVDTKGMVNQKRRREVGTIGLTNWGRYAIAFPLRRQNSITAALNQCPPTQYAACHTTPHRKEVKSQNFTTSATTKALAENCTK